jgi:hypothetical protein
METAIRATRYGERRPPRRVVLLSESERLATLLKHLLRGGDITRFSSLREADDRDGLGDADTVVLDLPREGAATTLAQVRHRYRGELLVLTERGYRSAGVAPDPFLTTLERPFSAIALAAAVGRLAGLDRAPAGPTATARPTAPASNADRYLPLAGRRPAGPAATMPAAVRNPPAPEDVKARARRAPSWAQLPTGGAGRTGVVERVARLVVALTAGWQARRRVRIAGFSAFALVAFTVAFALAAQSRCGPGCDALGTGFSPKPTIASSGSRGPSTTTSKRPTTTTMMPAGTPGTGAFHTISGGAGQATTILRRVTTTTAQPSGSSATTRPATTQPPTTTPTTQPPTTTPTTAPPTTGGA